MRHFSVYQLMPGRMAAQLSFAVCLLMAATALPSETPQIALEPEENPLLREFVINDFSTIRDEVVDMPPLDEEPMHKSDNQQRRIAEQSLSSSPSKASSFIPSRLLNSESIVSPPLRRRRTKMCKLTKRGKTCSRFVDAVRIPKLSAFPEIYELNPQQASRPVPVYRSILQFTRPKKHTIIVGQEPAKFVDKLATLSPEHSQEFRSEGQA